MDRLDIQIESVKVRFHSDIEPVIHPLSLTLYHGNVTALVGESGSGKSVLGKTLVGLLENATIEGAIHYDHRELVSITDGERHDLRGKDFFFMPQDPLGSLNPTMTVGDQLTEAVEYHHGWNPVMCRKEALQMLHETGLDEVERIYESYPHELSGGMAQRVLCSMACLLSSKWLIVDEPTKGLDVVSRHDTVELFRQVQQRTGCGLVIITHDMRMVKALADEVIVLQQGRVVAQGAMATVMENGANDYVQQLLFSQIGAWKTT